jgi:hypothetical protein
MCDYEKDTNHLTDSELILSPDEIREFLDDELKAATAYPGA